MNNIQRLRRRRTKKVVLTFLTLVLPLCLFLLFLLFPFYWMLVTSIKTNAEIYSVPLIYWPKELTWATYVNLFGYFNFLKYMKNSLIVALGTTVLSLVVSTLAAYSFARFSFKGRKALMAMFLTNNMFPTVLLMIPLYSIMSSAHRRLQQSRSLYEDLHPGPYARAALRRRLHVHAGLERIYYGLAVHKPGLENDPCSFEQPYRPARCPVGYAMRRRYHRCTSRLHNVLLRAEAPGRRTYGRRGQGIRPQSNSYSNQRFEKIFCFT